MEKAILTVADASDLLSIPEAEVERLLSRGELPGRKIGPHWFLSRQRLLQFIGEETIPAPAEVEAPHSLSPKCVPAQVLAPNWRCEACREILPPERVECPRCGAARNTPLMGYQLSPSASAAIRLNRPKIN